MSYVSKTLVRGEQVVGRGKFPWLYTCGCWIMILLGVIAAIPTVAVSLVVSLIGVYCLIRKWTTEIAVTNRRLIYKTGWISRRTEEMNLNRIEELNLVQGILGRILGYGKLVCNGTGSGDIKLPTIASPMSFRKVVQEAQFQSKGD